MPTATKQHDVRMDAFVRETTKTLLKDVARRVEELRDARATPGRIHRLRVSVRKTASVIDAFAQFWKPRRAKALLRELHRLGRLCGKVRDCDIALSLLEQVGGGKKTVAALKIQKKRRRRKMSSALDQWKGLDLVRSWRRKLPFDPAGNGPWSPGKTASANALAVLPEKFQVMLSAGQSALHGDVENYTELHRFRITVKEVRYLLELFQDVVAPELNTRLDELTRLQTRLGKIIDCVVARDLVRGLRGENKLAELAKLKRQQFADFWETDFYPAWSL